MCKNRLLIIDAKENTKKSKVKTKDFPWNYDGIPTCWSNQVMVARGMETSVYRIMPNASFPQHNSPDEFIGIMDFTRKVQLSYHIPNEFLNISDLTTSIYNQFEIKYHE